MRVFSYCVLLIACIALVSSFDIRRELRHVFQKKTQAPSLETSKRIVTKDEKRIEEPKEVKAEEKEEALSLKFVRNYVKNNPSTINFAKQLFPDIDKSKKDIINTKRELNIEKKEVVDQKRESKAQKEEALSLRFVHNYVDNNPGMVEFAKQLFPKIDQSGKVPANKMRDSGESTPEITIDPSLGIRNQPKFKRFVNKIMSYVN
ncbi:hypothetical protein K502DRAFT_345097 [Neoconidiobolus thromboides FSU 785]|nr:hypothetical protein K502DRAFT_345097 [Neoconidiobolus thromboides FSU 785]